MTKPEIGAGDVDIEIDGQTYVLRPSLGAAQALSKNGGLSGAVNRCLSMEMDTLVQVITQGLARSSRDLPEKIYKTGLRNVSTPCIVYLTNLSNGGRPLPEEGEDDAPLGEGEK